jgi:predicted membrane GTPase involved in stress response
LEKTRGDDMCVNVTKEKNNLTFVHLEMMKKLELFLQLFSLEEALEYIQKMNMLRLTKSIRLRKDLDRN